MMLVLPEQSAAGADKAPIVHADQFSTFGM